MPLPPGRETPFEEKTLPAPPPPERDAGDLAALLFGDGTAPPPPDETVGVPPPDPNARTVAPLGRTMRPGAELGRYRLIGEIGRGGMGVVYRALDHKLGREVALKVLLVAGRVGKEAIDRFQREALAAAALDHPHIIRVLDVGRLPGEETEFPFYAMELLAGEDLDHAIAAKRVSPREAVEVVRQVALALEYAHQRGILHRDVKPHNIFLRREDDLQMPSPRTAASDAPTALAKAPSTQATRRPSGTRPALPRDDLHALLLDFGLAKLTEQDLAGDATRAEGGETIASLTRSGEILGTPVYMPPEQIRSARDLDARADVYGLGATLYHALTGRPPFENQTLADLLDAVQQRDPTSPAALNDKVDRDLDTLCMKCLAKEPKDRYATAADLAEDCRRYLAGEPLVARPVGWIGRLWRKARRNRSIAKLSIALAVTLLASVGLVFQSLVLPSLRAAAASRKAEADRADRRAKADALLSEARAALARGDLGAAEEEASRLVQEYASWAEQEKDLPICEAHIELARVRDASKDPKGALVEYYRAFEQVVGTPRAAGTLALVGDQLYALDEVERAQGMFTRALEEHPGARDEFVARLGLARCKASRMQFDAALAEARRIASRPEAEPAERASIARLVEFLSRVTPSVEIPVSLHAYTVADLDHDRIPEIVGITADGRSVVVGHVRDALFEEASRLEVVSAGRYGLDEIAPIDVDGKGNLEIAVGGGVPGEGQNSGEGAFAVLGFEGGRLVELGRAPICADVRGSVFASADFDGDGVREIAVGTSWYDRRIRLFHLDAKGLVPVGEIDPRGDVWGLLARDADADGVPELWAFVGPWGGWSILCLQVDRATRQWVARSRTPFAGEAHLDRSCDGRAPGSILVGALWSEEMLRPLVAASGRQQIEATYHPPGAYDVTLGPDLHAALTPLLTFPFPETHAVRGTAAELFGAKGRWAWVSQEGLPEGETPEPEGRYPIRVMTQGEHGWETFLVLHPMSGCFCCASAHDLDGDGDAELIAEETGVEGAGGRIGALLVLGMGEATKGASAAAGAEPAPMPPLERRSSRALQSAREADRLHLDGEAIRGYEQVLQAPSSEEDLGEAALGYVRCAARLGRHAEAARMGREQAGKYPRLRAAIDREVLEGMDAAGEWALALAAAQDLLTCPGLPRDEAGALPGRVRRLDQLAHPVRVYEATGPRRAEGDLLATSPLFARMGEGGELTVWSASDGDDWLFVPVSWDGSGLRVTAEVEAMRHEWETNLEIGLATGEAWAPVYSKQVSSFDNTEFPRPPALLAALLYCTGDNATPARHWALAATSGGRHLSDWSHSYAPGADERGTIELEYASHQRKVRCRFADAKGERRTEASLDPIDLTEERVFLAVMARGIAGAAGSWGVFRLPRLSLEAGSANVRRIDVKPRGATELMMLANGRWIQGRTDEALAAYGQAIDAGDVEAARDAELEKRGLPTARKTRWAERLLDWVAVDARVWRGLLRAARGDEAGAEADLEAAHALSAARVERLFVNAAAPLGERPKEAAAVRAFLMKQMGFKPPAESRLFGEALLQIAGGADLAASLLTDQGYEVRTVLEVREEAGPLRAGDRLLSYDGPAVRTLPSLWKAESAARAAGKKGVTVAILREGRTMRVEVDPTQVSIHAAEAWEILTKRR